MSSNLMSEPIESDGEVEKGAEGGGEFFIAGGNAAEALQAAEAIFDSAAVAIEPAVARDRSAAMGQGGNTGADALAHQAGAEDIRVEATIGDPPASAGTTAAAPSQPPSAKPARNLGSVISAPSPTPRRPTPKPSASSNPRCASGLTPKPTLTQTNAPLNSTAGSIVITGIDLTAH